jgi:hypothetical protein
MDQLEGIRTWDELRWDSQEPPENKGKVRPHEPLVCGMDRKTDCNACRLKFYGSIEEE